MRDKQAEDQLLNKPRKDTIMQFTVEFDDEYPQLDQEYVLPWQLFVRDFWSKDMPVTDEIKELCKNKPHRLVDFRPYMNASPFTVTTTDNLEKCVAIFRYMHLRHLPVLHPGSGKLRGIITRKDLFRFMDL